MTLHHCVYFYVVISLYPYPPTNHLIIHVGQINSSSPQALPWRRCFYYGTLMIETVQRT